MQEIKAEIDYYLAHGSTELEATVIEKRRQQGENVDAKILEATYCDPGIGVSFREAQRVQGLHRLWSNLSNLGNIFEDMCKEA